MSPERAPRWVPVLLYHRVTPTPPPHDPYGTCVTPAGFERQLSWLARRGYRGVTLAEIDASLNGAAPLPPRPVAITFDDGYEDNHRHAWPILSACGFRAAIFVVSDAIGRDSSFDAAHTAERAPMLSAAQLRELRKGGIEIGSHSASHPDSLAALDDAALDGELSRSREALESLLGERVAYFAYPHSKHDPRVEAAVARAGYRLACGGEGSRFSSACVNRVEAGSASGISLEAHARVQQLKWRVRLAQGRRG